MLVGFATLYGKPAGNCSAIDSADPSDVPVDDILGAKRTGPANIGAFEVDGFVAPLPPRPKKTVLAWLLLLFDED
ncbi:MAG: hypothetical protein ACI9WC_000473 [Arenicella sp.]|jgi:hypothetical protein